MTAISRSLLKTYFETGDKPTQDQFAALIESFLNLNDDDITIAMVDGLSDALAGKTSATDVQDYINLLSNYKGKFTDLAQLRTAWPTANAGNTAIVRGTPHDQEYIWDSTLIDWVLSVNTPASTFALLGGSPADNAALAAALAAASAFSTGFIVNLPVNNTGVPNGTVVNAGDPIAPFLKSAFSQASQPNVTVNTNGNSQPYNQTGINLVVSIGYLINTSGATLANITLERSRDNATWTTLLNTATATSSYNDNGLNATIDNRPIYYRLTVTDSAGGTKSTTGQVTFAAYAAPGISFSVGSTTRERAVVSTTVTGNVNRNSPNVALTSYQLQYQVNSTGAWTNVGSPIAASGSSQAINVTHNDGALNGSDSLVYRIVVVDTQQSTTSATQTVTFIYPWFWGNASSGSTSFDIYATGNKVVASGAGSLVIPFNSSSQFEWFAVEATLSNKTAWATSVLDAGPIGGTGNLFGDPVSVTVAATNWSRTYKIYMTNYATSQTTNTIS